MENYWNLIKSFYSPEYVENNAKTKVGFIQKIFESNSHEPANIYFATYNPMAEIMADMYNVYVDEKFKDCVENPKIKLAALDSGHKFDTVMAMDEALTYCATEQEQKDYLEKLVAVCNGWLFTTLVDYKNLAPYKKNQVEASLDSKNQKILVEHHQPSLTDKQGWETYFHMIDGANRITTLGGYARRTMYFKQLAKYTSDLNSQEYIIQKNILYKGFGKKHWEHIITVRF